MSKKKRRRGAWSLRHHFEEGIHYHILKPTMSFDQGFKGSNQYLAYLSDVLGTASLQELFEYGVNAIPTGLVFDRDDCHDLATYFFLMKELKGIPDQARSFAEELMCACEFEHAADITLQTRRGARTRLEKLAPVLLNYYPCPEGFHFEEYGIG